MLKIFLLLSLILTPAYSYGQKELALNQPIIEGKSIAGIKLGDSEPDIIKSVGLPDKTESSAFRGGPSSQEGLKILIYILTKNNMLFVYTRHGKTEVIQLFWTGNGSSEYKGKTSKGIGIGDSIEDAKKQYGECEINKGFCWYKNMGISIVGDKEVGFIQITQPGTEIPDYIKPN